jgi:hypothetical protein
MNLVEILTFLFAVVVAASVALGVARVIDRPALISERFRWVFQRIKRIRLWHVMAAVAIVALLMATAEAPALWLIFGGIGLLVVFARAWVREVTFLMSLRDEDFPGRSDKLVWAFLLILMAPVGFWVFRAFRESRWPAPKPAVEAEPDQAFQASTAPNMV